LQELGWDENIPTEMNQRWQEGAQLIGLPRKRSEKLKEPLFYMLSGRNIPKSLNS